MKKLLLFLLLIHAPPAFAQIDLAGDWDHPGPVLMEDPVDRGNGPEVGDTLGVPLNEAGVLKAESYSPSWLNIPEHQCTPHPPSGALWNPSTLSINKEYDPLTRRLIAYKFQGTFGLDRIIWMDGRPHPSPDAVHTFNGFSTGRWDGDLLVVETSHLKENWLRRNGVRTSDRTTMIEYYIRRGNLMTVIIVLDDPVYLSEPYIRTTEYTLDTQPAPILGRPFNAPEEGPIFFKCFPAEELGGDKHHVPHFLPGASPLFPEFAKTRNVPEWVLTAGTDTMYPEFKKRWVQPGTPNVQVPRAPAESQGPRSNGVRSMHVQGQVWAVMGGGGNVTVQVGDEGVLVVDTGSEQMADAVLAEIRKIAGDKPIKYVINTSWNADHTGGDIKLSAPRVPQDQHAAVLANENVPLRLNDHNMSASSLTMDTFFGDSRSIHFNDEPIDIIHVPSAHTDSDIMVFFRKSDVIATGDILVNTSYPVIDLENGGSLAGSLDGLNRIIDITIPKFRQQGGTMVIPGHGRIYDEDDVVQYRDMLSIVRDRIQDSIKKSRTLEQIKAERPTLDYDGLYGATTGSWTTQMFIDAAYQSLKN